MCGFENPSPVSLKTMEEGGTMEGFQKDHACQFGPQLWLSAQSMVSESPLEEQHCIFIRKKKGMDSLLPNQEMPQTSK